MSTDNIPHGTPSGYKHHRCRCTPCTAANTAYSNERNRLIAYGRWNPEPDRDQVRAHVDRLIAADWTPNQIEQAAGVWSGSVVRLLADPEYQMSKRSAARILATIVDAVVLPTRSAAGSMNRLRCLCAIGYGLPSLAEQTGVSAKALSLIRSGRRTRVDARVHDAIVSVYRELSNTPAPAGRASGRARWTASANGWGPPAAWDDHWLDLTEEELEAELGREVARMDDAELHRNYRAAREQGELSPLVLAAAQEFNRVRGARDRQTRKAAA